MKDYIKSKYYEYTSKVDRVLHSFWTSSDTVEFEDGENLTNTMGDEDISMIGDGTVTGAILTLAGEIEYNFDKTALIVSTNNTAWHGKEVQLNLGDEVVATKQFNDSGKCSFTLNNLGNYTLSLVDVVGDYTIDYNNTVFGVTDKLSINPTKIIITSSDASAPGKMVTCQSSKESFTNPFSSEGKVEFLVNYKDTYNITSDIGNTSVTNTSMGSIINKSLGGSSEIASLELATDEEIVSMVNAHYRGELNLADYWTVGDKRKIQIAAIPTGNMKETHAPYEVDLVVMGINHDDLADGSGKAAITFSLSEAFPEQCAMHNTYEQTNWEECDRRIWCNETFFNALPEYLKELIKPVDKITSSNTVVDKCFLISMSELKGSGDYQSEGNQYAINKTLAPDFGSWAWTRTVFGTSGDKSDMFYACGSADDRYSFQDVNQDTYICPLFCI